MSFKRTKNMSAQQKDKMWPIESWFIKWKQNIELTGREPLVWNLMLLRMGKCFPKVVHEMR